MSAEYKKWGEGERTLLKSVLPLDTPISIQIEPSSACNFKCKYCFQSNPNFIADSSNKIMDWLVFEKIIDELKLFRNKVKTITFARDGEPTLNKLLPEMISYTKRSGVCDTIKIITNGSMLTPELNIKLIEGGLDVLRISLQGITSQQYYETSGVKIDIEEFKANIKHFYQNKKECKVYIKVLDKIIEGDEQEFLKMFSDVCDEIFIEHLVDLDHKNNNENLNMMNEKVLQNVKVCSMPFYSINISADGSILPCCGDYYKNLTFGNVNDRSLIEYWNSDELKKFQINQLEGKRFDNDLCRTCVVPTFVLQKSDVIDGFAEELLNNKWYELC